MHHVLVMVEKTFLFSVHLVSLGSVHALTLLVGLQLALVKVALVEKALFPPLHALTPLSPSPSPINVLIQENPLTFLECGGPHSWRPEPTLRAGVPLLALETRGRCGIRVDTHGAPAKWPERALKCPLPACGLGENFKDPRPLKSDLSCY